jgi:hypothetical protein
MKNQEEVWLPIKGYEGLYEVSNLGRIKSLKRYRVKNDRVLKQSTDTCGYPQLTLNKNGVKKSCIVHKLVAIAFLNHKPNGMELVVDHIDNNKLNNNVGNLQIITQRENASKDRSGYSSKYVGVTYIKRNNKWKARIYVKPKFIQIGTFETELEAHNAYEHYKDKLD